MMEHQSWMPHGYCYAWEPVTFWSFLIGDILMAASYFALSGGMMYVAFKKRFKPKFTWVPSCLYLFACFIFLCGAGHAFDIVTTWHAYYQFSSLLRLVGGAVSVATAVIVIWSWPKLRTMVCDG